MKNLIFFLIIFIYSPAVLFGQNSMKGPNIVKEKKVDIIPNGTFYDFYKKYISPADGDRCPMYPSCSAYSKQAFTKYGFMRGFIMTADRLTRCGSDLHNYQKFILKGKMYAFDPVEIKQVKFKINK